MSSRSVILLAALITEGLLIVVSYVIAGLCDIEVQFFHSSSDLLLGCLYAVPLLGMNKMVWQWSLTHPEGVYARFSREVVSPLCKQVRPPLALTLATLSGFGEELFFRGVLNGLLISRGGLLCAAVVSSFLFAYVHFIGQVKRFGGLLPLYTLVGLYLWLIHLYHGSLFMVMITHGVYNFVVIVALGTRLRRPSTSP